MEKINKGIIIFAVGFVVVAIISVITMIYIVIARGKEMKEFVAKESYHKETLVGMGGNILDDNGKYLAYYSPTFKAIWDTETANRYIRNTKSTYDKILKKEEDGEKINIETKNRYKKALAFNSVDSLTYYMDVNFKNKYNKGKSYKSKITAAYKKNSGYNLISDGNTFSDIDLMRTFPFFKLHIYRGGFKVEENFKVDFLNKSITGRTLGQEMYDDPERRQGLIHTFKDTLMGKTKVVDVEITAKKYKPINIGEDFIPDDGRDVLSTLNYEISEFAYTALMRMMKKSQANRGCVIVMDVATGDIKAMVSLVKNKDNFLHSENVAIKHVYEPGSVFKLASYMVAMNDGLINWNKEYELGTSDRRRVGPRIIVDSHKPKNAFETPAEIFSESSNIGTCSIVWEHYATNQQKFIDGLRKMHIGEMVGIGVEGEGKPFLKDTKTQIKNKEWWKVSLVQIAYGYEVEITPLQMATFYNAIANNGVYVKPRLVRGISANKSYEEEIYPVTVIDTICTPEIAAKACEILTLAAHEGTGKTVFKNANYSFAGKTGTAQYNVGTEKRPTYNASFAGFFPSENPKYTIYVLISEPKERIYMYGAQSAAPVAREIADKIAATDKRFFDKITIDSSTSKVWNKIAELNE